MRKIMQEILLKEVSLDSERKNFDKSLEFVTSDEFRKKVLALTKVAADLTKQGMTNSGQDPSVADEMIASITKQEITSLVMDMIKTQVFGKRNQ